MEAALSEIGQRFAGKSVVKVADIGTGSGAIAVSIALHAPQARVTAVDIDPQALQIAALNVERMGVAGRVRLVRGDLLNPLRDEVYDGILSNPPYIAENEWPHLPPDVREYEPRQALIGGRDGLDLIRRLVEDAMARLSHGGFLAIEIGAGQAEAVLAMAQACGYAESRVVKDLAGIDRVVIMAKERGAVAADESSPG